MTPIIGGTVLAVSNSLAGSIAAKATIIAAIGFIGVRLARRSRAALRHAVLAATFGVLLMLPIASILVPPIRIAMQIMTQDRAAKPLPAGNRNSGVTRGVQASDYSALATQNASGLTMDGVLLMGWMTGVALFLLPMVLGLRQVRSLRRTALPWAYGQSVARRMVSGTGIAGRVEVLVHEELPGPMTCGVFQPAVVLPQDAQTWSAEDLDRAIVHELEHVRRGDWLGRCLARGVCALYWFHPLVWIAWRQFELEAERSCDDAVLGRSDAISYADQLVGLARQLSMVRTPFLGMANRTDLTTRVAALLDGKQRRGRAGRLCVSLTCGAGLALVLIMSPLRVVAAPQAVTEVRNPVPRFLSNTMLVIEDVTVTDKSGKAIAGLSASDFVVSEDGRPNTISLFEFQDLGPFAGLQNSLTSYYVFGYYTTNARSDGTRRNVTIALRKDASAELNYRPGYFAAQLGVPDVDMAPDGNSGIEPGVKPPTLISKVDPAYTEEARKAKYSGTVLLNVTVDASGQSVDLRVLRSLGMGLDEKAIEAVQQWRFRPAMKDGNPVPSQAQVEVIFRIL
jgi:TonB family protein